jgi:hypothetical protein
MKTFSFITSKSFRIDVKASTPRAAYNKLNKQLIQHLTTSYYEYNKDGLVDVTKIKTLQGV